MHFEELIYLFAERAESVFEAARQAEQAVFPLIKAQKNSERFDREELVRRSRDVVLTHLSAAHHSQSIATALPYITRVYSTITSAYPIGETANVRARTWENVYEEETSQVLYQDFSQFLDIIIPLVSVMSPHHNLAESDQSVELVSALQEMRKKVEILRSEVKEKEDKKKSQALGTIRGGSWGESGVSHAEETISSRDVRGVYLESVREFGDDYEYLTQAHSAAFLREMAAGNRVEAIIALYQALKNRGKRVQQRVSSAMNSVEDASRTRHWVQELEKDALRQKTHFPDIVTLRLIPMQWKTLAYGHNKLLLLHDQEFVR